MVAVGVGQYKIDVLFCLRVWQIGEIGAAEERRFRDLKQFGKIVIGPIRRVLSRPKPRLVDHTDARDKVKISTPERAGYGTG